MCLVGQLAGILVGCTIDDLHSYKPTTMRLRHSKTVLSYTIRLQVTGISRLDSPSPSVLLAILRLIGLQNIAVLGQSFLSSATIALLMVNKAS